MGIRKHCETHSWHHSASKSLGLQTHGIPAPRALSS
jgi:hypothetical protein